MPSLSDIAAFFKDLGRNISDRIDKNWEDLGAFDQHLRDNGFEGRYERHDPPRAKKAAGDAGLTDLMQYERSGREWATVDVHWNRQEKGREKIIIVSDFGFHDDSVPGNEERTTLAQYLNGDSSAQNLRGLFEKQMEEPTPTVPQKSRHKAGSSSNDRNQL